MQVWSGPHLRGGLWVQAWSLQKVAGHCLRGQAYRLRCAVCATAMQHKAARRGPRTGQGRNSRSCCRWHACMEAQPQPAELAGIGLPPCRCGRPASWLQATQIAEAPATLWLQVSGRGCVQQLIEGQPESPYDAPHCSRRPRMLCVCSNKESQLLLTGHRPRTWGAALHLSIAV
jgi:hypothetical protein